MDRSYGMTDFFTMEASEYLERLDGLVSAPNPPGGEELQRLARALRGAALMANQQPIAATAGAFEHLARALREGRLSWDEGTRQLSIRAIDDLKVFVRRTREWSDADTARARELAGTLERAGGRPAAPARMSGAVGADTGTRAFVAREGAALASALARVAEAVRHNPAVTEPVQTLLKQMQPMRGLASLGEYPPLPDLLDGIERAAALVARAASTVPEPGKLLDAAARALTNATRDITTTGKADPDAPEVRQFAATLRGALGLAEPEVDIESLYGDDAEPVAAAGSPPGTHPLGQVELTSLGEHLKQVGVSVAQARTGAQRELRILALVDSLRTLEQGVAATMQEAVRRFARACRDAIARSVVSEHPEPLGHAIQEAGIAVAAGTPDRLTPITAHIEKLVTAGAEAARPYGGTAVSAPAAAATPAAPARPAAPPAPAVVVAPVPPADATPPPADSDRETPDLAGSFIRYERLVEELGLEGASLEELIGAAAVGGPTGRGVEGPALSAPAAPTVVAGAGRAPAPTAPAPRAAPAAAAAEPPPVPIASLQYSPRDALARALSLKAQVHELVAAGAPAEVVEELLEEVFDLVRLGAEASA